MSYWNPENKTMLQTAATPIVSGLLAGGVVYFLGGSSDAVNVLGFGLHPAIVVGAATGVSSLGAEFVKNYALKNYPSVQSFSALLKPAVTGAASFGVMTLLVPDLDKSKIITIVGVSAAAEMASGFLYKNTLDRLLS